MKVKEVTELLALASKIDATLVCSFSGKVDVTLEEPAVGDKLGFIFMMASADFFAPEHPAGEDWEFYSLKDGRALKHPSFRLESGEEITLEQAREMASERV